MQKQYLKVSEPEESLCCCEYVNHNGEKSHLVACCCDCQDLDEACDRWLKCESLEPETLERISDVISDRLRIPWVSGARKIDLTILPPLILLPVFLHVAALHFLLGVVILIALPVAVMWYYYVIHRKKGQTLFFLSLALFSLAYMYYVFLKEVVARGDVGPTQLTIVSLGLVFTLVLLALAKRDPGYLRDETNKFSSDCRKENASKKKKLGALNGIHNVMNSSSTSGSADIRKDWCALCKVLRLPRAGHCRICMACVRRMDHHCVWINNCVGEQNHRAFLLALLLFLLTSVYGISLTLGTICKGFSVVTALFYCPGVYAQYSSALSFTCVWYCAIVAAGMGHLFLIQVINVSYNVTEREARIALRERVGRKRLWGLVVDTGSYNHGLFANWKEFLTLASSRPSRPCDEHLV
ncbi:palmitoyltransferase ZDHHC23-B [Latimeria chalumnae]|uniref:palmitoyltransferase ZDHHC23-B n=1 Tax=Latimeria chalumnae TaxID=7897 RepID=UPI0003C15F3B|nr:PREDICTED: palmitoyltransferase ZDHHC23 [Latimeria chalumnae]|eukprot:XP_014343249.1 PREDICTED: palmitoyltransferase ZDHHC23 [Latimeria chalumnae]